MNLEAIFPIKLQINILQLEEYKSLRFLKWLSKNFLTRKIETKKPLVFTTKIKRILAISGLVSIFLSISVFLFTTSILYSVLSFIFIWTQPYILLLISLIIIKPYEIYNRFATKNRTKEKILGLKKKGLKVVAITGSYGKTSTKEILYQLLKDKYRVLRTPESFNTLFGIAKVVDLELSDHYDYFICEMAAYKKDEIKELCEMVPPNYGILTGIAPQHLERFGSLKNIIDAKFELQEAIDNQKNILLNLDNHLVSTEAKKRNLKPQGFFAIKNEKVSKDGSYFETSDGKKKYKVRTNLFGFSNIKNVNSAISMAKIIGVDVSYLIKKSQNLRPFSNRFVLKKFGHAMLVDNTYSSNVSSFRETIKTASVIGGKKVLVTPGIVELGNEEQKIHKELGDLCKNVFDKVVLVGKNNKTESFASTVGGNYKFIEDKRDIYSNEIDKLKEEFDWIFLENDVTQNY